MIEDGLFDDFNIDEVYALHNWPELPLGSFGVNSSASKITFKELSAIPIQGTRTSLDGRGAIFLATSNPDGQLLKTNFAMPTQFAASQDVFDNTVTNFAQTTLSFDDTTP